MKINFYKYQGAGNDFVILDNRNNIYSDLTKEQIEFICDRRFGVGADGLMTVSQQDGYDFRMRYFNSDGGEAEMCGNGARCIVAFAKKLGLIDNKAKFVAMDGEHTAYINDGRVKVHMSDVSEVEIGEDYYYLNTGVPHYVKIVNNIGSLEIVEEGRKIRYNNRFKEVGTNVNFIELTENGFDIRTYERGVEDETLACGTGCTASAIAASIALNHTKNSFNIKAKGGNLGVSFEKNDTDYKNIWLEGPAEMSFKGEIQS
jgi:diaminopimelate epimerase